MSRTTPRLEAVVCVKGRRQERGLGETAMRLYCLNVTKPLGERIAAAAGVSLAPHEERDFEDTEFKVRPLESARGVQAFVCQSLAADDEGSANDKLCRLLFLIGALKDDGAAEVIALVPYLAYARKDRRTKPHDPVTTRYVAALFEAVGTDVIVTLDVHNPAAFDNAFRRPKLHLEAAPLFAAHFAARTGDAERIVVLSPDAGGVKRARIFASHLATSLARPVDLAFLEKARSEGRVTGDAFGGDVRDAEVIVFDDLISSGTTLARAARAAVARGARRVHGAATHALFGTGSAETLAVAELESIVVTDSAGDPRRRLPALREKLEVLECAPLFVAAIAQLTR